MSFTPNGYRLMMSKPAPSLKGQFGPKGALFSGWESRRHNPTYDWCEHDIFSSCSGRNVDSSVVQVYHQARHNRVDQRL